MHRRGRKHWEDFLADTASTVARGSLAAAYQEKLREGWQADEAQQAAVTLLHQLLASLASSPKRPLRGLYLHGPVGRGKSQLLKLFMGHAAPLSARRTHMHAFMAEIHQRMFEIKSGDPVQQTARQMADEYRVFGFDEFYITNIADAMLLGRLFQHLFKYGVVVVATSNYAMEDLYLGGRNRQAFLPFLRLLQKHLQPVDLGDGRDYRQSDDPDWPLYVIAGPDQPAHGRLEALFDRYALTPAPSQGEREASETAPPEEIEAKAFRGGCAWYRFADICEKPLGRLEYLKLIERAGTVIVEGVPEFTAANTEPALRLVTLVDICYEYRRRVVISAPAYPDDLYLDGPVRDAFRRGSSRLAEMQTWA